MVKIAPNQIMLCGKVEEREHRTGWGRGEREKEGRGRMRERERRSTNKHGCLLEHRRHFAICISMKVSVFHPFIDRLAPVGSSTEKFIGALGHDIVDLMPKIGSSFIYYCWWDSCDWPSGV